MTTNKGENMCSEEDDPWDDETGPFCIHWETVYDCVKICEYCGHTCNKHRPNCEECPCTDFEEATQEPIIVEAPVPLKIIKITVKQALDGTWGVVFLNNRKGGSYIKTSSYKEALRIAATPL